MRGYEVASAAVAYTDAPAENSDNPLVAGQKAEMPAPTKVKTTSFKQASVAVPSPAPAYMPPEQPAGNSVDALTTASSLPRQLLPNELGRAGPTGWVVQIGVSSSQATWRWTCWRRPRARAARHCVPQSLSLSLMPDGGEQIYRARFGGFDDQREAVNACNALKRAGVKCWASAQ